MLARANVGGGRGRHLQPFVRRSEGHITEHQDAGGARTRGEAVVGRLGHHVGEVNALIKHIRGPSLMGMHRKMEHPPRPRSHFLSPSYGLHNVERGRAGPWLALILERGFHLVEHVASHGSLGWSDPQALGKVGWGSEDSRGGGARPQP